MCSQWFSAGVFRFQVQQIDKWSRKLFDLFDSSHRSWFSEKSGQTSAASAVVTPKCDLLAWTTYVHAHSQRSTDRTFFTSMTAKQLFMISWKRWRHHALSFGCRYCVLAELYHPRRSCVVSTTWATPETSLSQSFPDRPTHIFKVILDIS